MPVRGRPAALLSPIIRRRPRGTPTAILALAAVAATAAAVRGGFTDLVVYRHAGRAVLDGLPVYGAHEPVTGLPFTYPPFAAVLMVPLALLPAWLASALWTGASVAALAGVVLVVRGGLGRPTPGWLLALVVVAALALEPVWQNLTFGQVNLLLVLAVLVDLVRPERRTAGVLVGIAAGVKLTPLVLVVLLALVGRRAAAGRAGLAFLGTVAVGFVAMPGPAVAYWTDGLLDPGRVGPPALAHNQSVYGALTRLLDGRPPTLLWLGIVVPLVLATLLAAGWWWRRDRVLGTCLGALAMLLASPVSWSHHWVWAVPVALALWVRSRWAAGAWTAVFVARPVLWPPWGQGREYAWSPADHVVGNAYVLAALALAAWAATRAVREATGRRTSAGDREQLDEVAGGDGDQDLAAAGARDHVAAEGEPGGAQVLDLGVEVVDGEVDPVAARGRGVRGRVRGPEREGEVRGVEADRGLHVVDDGADAADQPAPPVAQG